MYWPGTTFGSGHTIRDVPDSAISPGLPESSWATTPGIRRVMQGNRSRDTRPEVAVRRLVHGAGYRYRIHSYPVASIRRRADMVFTCRRIAVFIDGCFWHACPDHFVAPKRNVEYWDRKIAKNRTRDTQTNDQLRRAGWDVLRFWEHESPDEIAAKVIRTVRSADRRRGVDRKD